MEEELLALKEIAERKKQELAEKNNILLREEGEEGGSEVSEEPLFVRDSFALDYIPDYDPDNPNDSDMQSNSGLNKSALEKL